MKPFLFAVLGVACAVAGCTTPPAAGTGATTVRKQDGPDPGVNARGRIYGRVDRRGMQAWVGVFGAEGRIAGRWIERQGFPFDFRDLPTGEPLVTVTWSPMAASEGAVEILRAAGTPRYREVFERVAKSIGRSPGAGESIEWVLTVEHIDKPIVRVTLKGLDPDAPRPAEAVIKVGLHVDESDLGEGHGCVTREYDQFEPMPDGPFELEIECDCGLELGWEVRIAGYEPVKRRIPLPPNPGPIPLSVELTKLRTGTHAVVVDGRTRAPIAGALVLPAPVAEPEDHSGGIPGLGGNDDEFEEPQEWAKWLKGGAADERGRFPITNRLMDERFFGRRVMAIQPGVGCSRWTDLGSAIAPVQLEIVPGNVIEGVVTDVGTGRPAAGVTVVLERHRTWRTGEEPEDSLRMGDGHRPPPYPKTRYGVGVAARTDAQGRYRFAGVPPEWYVRPIVLTSPRATPVGAAPAVEYEGALDAHGRFERADVTAWLARRLEVGELVRFADVGMRATCDLRATVTPGRWLKVRVRQPGGDEPPDALDLDHLHTATRPAREGEEAGEEEIDAGTTDVRRTVHITDGLATIVTRRTTTIFWDRFNDAEDAPREATLYLPLGANELEFTCGEYAPVRLSLRIESDGGAPLERGIVFRPR